MTVHWLILTSELDDLLCSAEAVRGVAGVVSKVLHAHLVDDQVVPPTVPAHAVPGGTDS